MRDSEYALEPDTTLLVPRKDTQYFSIRFSHEICFIDASYIYFIYTSLSQHHVDTTSQRLWLLRRRDPYGGHATCSLTEGEAAQIRRFAIGTIDYHSLAMTRDTTL